MIEPNTLMTIGDFARDAGLTPKVLRLYDDLGLLPPMDEGGDDASAGRRVGLDLAPVRLDLLRRTLRGRTRSMWVHKTPHQPVPSSKETGGVVVDVLGHGLVAGPTIEGERVTRP